MRYIKSQSSKSVGIIKCKYKTILLQVYLAWKPAIDFYSWIPVKMRKYMYIHYTMGIAYSYNMCDCLVLCCTVKQTILSTNLEYGLCSSKWGTHTTLTVTQVILIWLYKVTFGFTNIGESTSQLVCLITTIHGRHSENVVHSFDTANGTRVASSD